MNSIYIADSKIPGAGRGVFANMNFKPGDLIESCPILEIPQAEFEDLGSSFLVNYLFYFGQKLSRAGLVMGLGSFYNHSLSPNAKIDIDVRRGVIDFIALKNIRIGDEITFNYYNNADPNAQNLPLWFEI